MEECCGINTRLGVNVRELRKSPSLRISKELGNWQDVGSRFALSLSPGVELGVWIEARVVIVDPSDIIL